MTHLKIGDIAPDFTLPSHTGDIIKLSHYIGKKNIVIFFYPKDDSYVCTKEACQFRDNYDVFIQLGAEVIGISTDTIDSHSSFVNKHRLPFILLSDNQGKVREQYGVGSTLGFIPGRITFIVDKKGVIQHIFSSQIQYKQHVSEAVKKLQELENS